MCEGALAQSITLDASLSLGPNALPSQSLTYEWSVVPEPSSWSSGGPTKPLATAVVDVTQPVSIRLTVTDEQGGTAELTRVLTLTRTTPTPCSAPCAEGEVCAAFSGQRRCVDSLACNNNAACGPCLVCRPDDEGVGRCVGP